MTSASNSISSFIDRLLVKAGLDSLPADYRQQYVAKLEEQINRRVGLVALQALDESAAEQFGQMLNSDPKPTSDQLQSFFQTHIPDFEIKLKAELEKFSAEFILAAAKK